MNRENPVIRPYEKLELIEELAKKIAIRVGPIGTDTFTIESGERLVVPANELRQLGLKIFALYTSEEVVRALGFRGLSSDDVRVEIVADARFLHERQVLITTDLTGLIEGLVIRSRGSQRPEVLMDQKHGYSIIVNIVLAREFPKRPLSPRWKGTILADAKFRFQPSNDFKGLNPEPMTQEVRDAYNLPVSSHVYVHCEADDLLSLASLTDQLRVFVNEKVYSECAVRRTDTSVHCMSQAAMEALREIVYRVSAELSLRESLQDLVDHPPVIIQMLQYVLNNHVSVGKSYLQQDLVLMIQADPARVAAIITGPTGFSTTWEQLVKDSEVAGAEGEVEENQ